MLTRGPDGRIVVRAPGGWLIPAVPRNPCSTPAMLMASNAQAGATVTVETLPSEWRGDQLDLNYAISVLLAAS